MATNKSIPEISVEARLLSQRLAEATVGEVITYAELSALISRDVATQGQGALRTARHRSERDLGLVFECIRKEGLKRMSTTEIVETSTATLARIRRAARRGRRKLAHATRPDEPISQSLQLCQVATASVLHAIESMATDASVKRIGGTFKGGAAAAELPIGKTLELMRG